MEKRDACGIMGTRGVLHIVFALMTLVATAQTEEQYKFALPDSLAEYTLLEGIDGTFGLSALQHSDYTYYDIYLDTDDGLMQRSGYSLRMRKRIFNDSLVTYSMQLKSEMSDTSVVRVEVEEKELDFYRIREHNDEFWFVTDLMDVLFESVGQTYDEEANVNFQYSVEHINKWLESVANTIITPYQYLSHVDSAKFSRSTLSQLKIQWVGVSYRVRGHVYSKSDSQFPKVYRIEQETPPFFLEHSEAVWLMETSLDYSIFYPVDQNEKPVHIREFEVERKYPNRELVQPVMEDFASELQKTFNLIPQQKSKFLQAEEAY